MNAGVGVTDQGFFISFKEVIFLFFWAIGILIYKLLKFLLPKTYALFVAHIKEELLRDLSNEVKSLKEELIKSKNNQNDRK